MIPELFKMVNGKYSTDACIKYKFVDREVNRTRANKFKIGYFKTMSSIIYVNIFSLTELF